MQNIKFRAFSLKTNDWVYGYYAKFRNFKNEVYECIIPMDKETGEAYMENITSFAEGSLGQFTGMYDKNGKEIYEGDILKPFDSEMLGTVKFYEKLGWDGSGSMHSGYYCPEWNIDFSGEEGFAELDWLLGFWDCEIVGNVFQNKNLLNKIY